MKKLIFALFLLIPAYGFSQDVHQEIIFEGLSGNELLDSLVANYKPGNVLNYDNARDLMFSEVFNQEGINVCVYTGDTINIPFGEPNPRTIANSNDPTWNTEHVYPQSKGAGSGNARSDMHHLMPTRSDVNSSRGNLSFGFVEESNVNTWWGENGSQTMTPEGDLSIWSRNGSGLFEPLDSYKGDIARAVFYFYAMYQAQAEDADPTFFQGMYEELRKFHNSDKVDEFEINRTNAIADVQDGYVNPFIVDTTLVRRVFFEDFEFTPQVVEGEYFVDFETFSSGNKGGYASGVVDLNGVTWTLDNALIGSDTDDMKVDERSARLRHQTDAPAQIRMEGDKSMGLGTISFYYARSSFSGDRSDTAPVFIVEYSLDQGESWTQTGDDIDLAGIDELTLFESEINNPADGRIRIRSISGTNGRRFNIDNILITNYIETEADITITGREGWRMLSPPVKSVKLSSMLENIFTQGFNGADLETGDPNVYLFDEESGRFVAPESINESIDSGTGVIVFLFENDNRDESDTGTINRTIQLKGQEPGSLMYPMSFTQNGEKANDGWNLLGNPYNTALSVSELELFLKEEINDNIYVWDANKGSEGEYRILSSDNIDDAVAPFQGFWVKTDTTDQEFPFTKDAATDSGTFYKESGTEVVLSLSFNGNFEFSESRLKFSETGSTSFINRDAYSLTPLSGKHAFSYFEKGETSLSNAHFPIGFEDELRIPFSIESTVQLDGFLEADITGDTDGWSFVLEQVSTGDKWDLFNESVPFKYIAKEKELNPLVPQHPVKSKDNSMSGYVLIVSKSLSLSSNTEDPISVKLEQNYPNPFNPSTTIRYSVPQNQHVRIDVFDLLGRRVNTLVDGNVAGGHHKIKFDASGLSSGMYIYRLQTPGYVLTRKLTVIK